jgi:alpha-L-fucosidase
MTRFLADWVDRNLELIDKYQPDLLWFDNGANLRVLDPLKLQPRAGVEQGSLAQHQVQRLRAQQRRYEANRVYRGFRKSRRALTRGHSARTVDG